MKGCPCIGEVKRKQKIQKQTKRDKSTEMTQTTEWPTEFPLQSCNEETAEPAAYPASILGKR
jgi:hypothetical protein